VHHHVRRQTLQITVDSEALAFEIQPRLQHLNRAAFLPIIERVFDELSLADRRIFIERLEIDLGTVAKAESDQEIAGRFERKLREALRAAIERVERRPSGRERAQPDEQAQLETLERYLVTGTLPFWAPAAGFDLEAWIARLSASAPEGLIRLLRHRQFDEGVIKRLTNQIGEASVRRLFEPLDRPADAPVDQSDEGSRHELYRTDRQALAALLLDRRERLAVARFFQALEPTDLAALLRQIAGEIAAQAAADDATLTRTAAADRSEPTGSRPGDADADRQGTIGPPEDAHAAPLKISPEGRPAPHRLSTPAREPVAATPAGPERPDVGEQPARSNAADAAADYQATIGPPEDEHAAQIEIPAEERPAPPRLSMPAHETVEPGPAGPERPEQHRPPPPAHESGEAGLARTTTADGREPSARSITADAAAERFAIERSAEAIPAPGRISQPSEHVDEARLRHLHRTDRPALIALLRRLFGKEPLQWPLEKLHEPAEEWVRKLYRMDRRVVAALVRDRRERLLVERFLLHLDSRALQDLVGLLSPEQAEQIAADVVQLASMPSVHRQVGPGHALRLLWLMTADIQLRTLDRPYERRDFVKAVTSAFAESTRQTAHDLLTALSEDWRFMSEPDSPRVPGVPPLRTIVAELAGGGSFEPRRAVESEAVGYEPGKPVPMFARYDLADAAQYYLRHGVLPYSVQLLRPELTVADAIDVLPDLPLRSLRAALADLGVDARIHAWRRVVRQLLPLQATRLIDALVDETGMPEAGTAARPSAQALDAAGEQGRTAAYIVRLIDGGSAGRAPETTPETAAREDSGQPASEADRIKAVLIGRARGTAEAREQEPASLLLLRSLIERDVEGTRLFLQTLKQAGIRPSALVDEAPSEDAVKTTQKLLPAEAARRLTRLIESFLGLSPAERPADGLVYFVVASEIIEHVSASRTEQAFFEAVLDRLARAAREPFRHGEPPATPSPPQPSADTLVETWKSDTQRAIDRDTSEPAAPPAADALIETWRSDIVRGQAARSAAPARADVQPGEWMWRLGLVPEPAGASPLPPETMRHALLRAIDDRPESVHGALVDSVADRTIRERWSRTLSEPELVRMAYVLEPRLHRVLMDAAEVLFSAWLRQAADGSWPTERARFWSFVLGFLAETRATERSLDRLVEDFFEVFGSAAEGAGTFRAVDRPQWDPGGSEPETRSAWMETLLEAVIERASATGNAAVRAIVERDRAALTAPFPRPRVTRPVSPADAAPKGPRDAKSRTAPGPAPTRLAFGMVEDHAPSSEPIYIANAGLVLTNPFLPRWFQQLEMLEDVEPGKTRLRPDRFSRAVHLLQWLVDRSVATPEPQLCLNKLLCGGAWAISVERRIEPTEDEIEACQKLLKSILANWTVLSGTSIEGLQETFLQREGRLERTSDGWRLFVPRKTVDVLLDQLPWSISTVVHSWMPEPIFVTW
jgi:hypothetical protein